MGKAKLSFTREELVAAFEQWRTDYITDPDSFTDELEPGEVYGETAASVLITYLKGVNDVAK